MKTFPLYYYARADVTFRRLTLGERIKALFTGRVSPGAVSSFKISPQIIPASDEKTALDIARQTVIKSDIATDTISPAGDGWAAGN